VRLAFRVNLAVLVAALSVSATASAAPRRLEPDQRTGTRFAANPQAMSGFERRRIFSEFAACVHRRNPNKVDYFIRHSDDRSVSSEISDVASYLNLRECIADGAIGNTSEVEGVFSVRALRGWLTELSYVIHNHSMPNSAAASAVPRTFFSIGSKLDEAQGLGEFADCIASMEPEKADSLVRTNWGGQEEMAAARNLAPILGQCLPQGLELAMKVEIIRGYASSGLWQRFEAAKTPRYQGRP